MMTDSEIDSIVQLLDAWQHAIDAALSPLLEDSHRVNTLQRIRRQMSQVVVAIYKDRERRVVENRS